MRTLPETGSNRKFSLVSGLNHALQNLGLDKTGFENMYFVGFLRAICKFNVLVVLQRLPHDPHRSDARLELIARKELLQTKQFPMPLSNRGPFSRMLNGWVVSGCWHCVSDKQCKRPADRNYSNIWREHADLVWVLEIVL